MAQLSGSEVAELSERLRGVREAIEAGELEASSGMVARLEGALVALEAVLGREPVGSVIGPLEAQR